MAACATFFKNASANKGHSNKYCDLTWRTMRLFCIERVSAEPVDWKGFVFRMLMQSVSMEGFYSLVVRLSDDAPKGLTIMPGVHELCLC